MTRLLSFLLVVSLAVPLWSQTKSTRNVTIATKTRLCPKRTGNGDREFSGNGPRVKATARIAILGKTRIRLTLSLHAKETKSDWTEARGTWSYTVYTAPSGYKITRILSNVVSEAAYTDNNHKLDIPKVTRGNLVRRFEVMGDTGGNDVGNCTTGDVYMNVVFNTVRIEIQKLEKIITSFGANVDGPKQLVNKMSKSLTGICHDNQYWFFTQDDNLWKIPRSKNLAAVGDLVSADMTVAEIPPFLQRRGYKRFGDLDYYRGYLWVSLQGDGRVAKRPIIAVFKVQNMELITTLNIHRWQKSIGSLAINPSTGFLFSSVAGSTSFLNKYRVNINGDQLSISSPSRFNLFSKTGTRITLNTPQGAAFSSDGRYLFVSEKRALTGHLRAYNHRNGRQLYAANYPRTSLPRGVTFWNTGKTAPGISGNLHLLMLHPNPAVRDAYTFRHYTIKEGLDWNG